VLSLYYNYDKTRRSDTGDVLGTFDGLLLPYKEDEKKWKYLQNTEIKK